MQPFSQSLILCSQLAYFVGLLYRTVVVALSDNKLAFLGMPSSTASRTWLRSVALRSRQSWSIDQTERNLPSPSVRDTSCRTAVDEFVVSSASPPIRFYVVDEMVLEPEPVPTVRSQPKMLKTCL